MACGAINGVASYLSFRTPDGSYIRRYLYQLSGSPVPRGSVVVGCQVVFQNWECYPAVYTDFRPVMCFPSAGWGCTDSGGSPVGNAGANQEYYMYMSGYDYIQCNTSTVSGSLIVDGYDAYSSYQWEEINTHTFTIHTEITGTSDFMYSFNTTPSSGSSVEPGTNITCRLTITNDGNVTGATTGTITKNGTVVKTQPVSLAPGGSTIIPYYDSMGTSDVTYCGSITDETAKCSTLYYGEPPTCSSSDPPYCNPQTNTIWACEGGVWVDTYDPCTGGQVDPEVLTPGATPDPVKHGEVLSAIAEVWNKSLTSGGNLTVYVSIRQTPWIPIEEKPCTMYIGANEIEECNVTFNITESLYPAGNYYVMVSLVPNSGDFQGSIPFTVESSAADVSVYSLLFPGHEDGNLQHGDSLTIQATLQNNGTSPANVDVTFYTTDYTGAVVDTHIKTVTAPVGISYTNSNPISITQAKYIYSAGQNYHGCAKIDTPVCNTFTVSGLATCMNPAGVEGDKCCDDEAKLVRECQGTGTWVLLGESCDAATTQYPICGEIAEECDPDWWEPTCDDFGRWITCVDGHFVKIFDPVKCPMNGGEAEFDFLNTLQPTISPSDSVFVGDEIIASAVVQNQVSGTSGSVAVQFDYYLGSTLKYSDTRPSQTVSVTGIFSSKYTPLVAGNWKVKATIIPDDISQERPFTVTDDSGTCDSATWVPKCISGNWVTCVDNQFVRTPDPDKCPTGGGCADPGDVDWIDGNSYCKTFMKYECIDDNWSLTGVCIPKSLKVGDIVLIVGIGMIASYVLSGEK
jgi:hypothetical protein